MSATLIAGASRGIDLDIVMYKGRLNSEKKGEPIIMRPGLASYLQAFLNYLVHDWILLIDAAQLK